MLESEDFQVAINHVRRVGIISFLHSQLKVSFIFPNVYIACQHLLSSYLGISGEL